MKKIIIILVFIALLYKQMDVVDLRQYQSTTKTIEIKGEVKKPGVYQIGLHANVRDVIKLAGGCNEYADIDAVNMGIDPLNKSVIVIPKKTGDVKISINTADLETLDRLPGVGPAIAQRVIDYRQKTPFSAIEQIKEVKGIGDAMFDKIKEKIRL